MSISGCAMQIRLNNLQMALKCITELQNATNSPSVWAQLDEERIDLIEKIEDIKCQITKKDSQEI